MSQDAFLPGQLEKTELRANEYHVNGIKRGLFLREVGQALLKSGTGTTLSTYSHPESGSFLANRSRTGSTAAEAEALLKQNTVDRINTMFALQPPVFRELLTEIQGLGTGVDFQIWGSWPDPGLTLPPNDIDMVACSPGYQGSAEGFMLLLERTIKHKFPDAEGHFSYIYPNGTHFVDPQSDNVELPYAYSFNTPYGATLSFCINIDQDQDGNIVLDPRKKYQPRQNIIDTAIMESSGNRVRTTAPDPVNVKIPDALVIPYGVKVSADKVEVDRDSDYAQQFWDNVIFGHDTFTRIVGMPEHLLKLFERDPQALIFLHKVVCSTNCVLTPQLKALLAKDITSPKDQLIYNFVLNTFRARVGENADKHSPGDEFDLHGALFLWKFMNMLARFDDGHTGPTNINRVMASRGIALRQFDSIFSNIAGHEVFKSALAEALQVSDPEANFDIAKNCLELFFDRIGINPVQQDRFMGLPGKIVPETAFLARNKRLNDWGTTPNSMNAYAFVYPAVTAILSTIFGYSLYSLTHDIATSLAPVPFFIFYAGAIWFVKNGYLRSLPPDFISSTINKLKGHISLPTSSLVKEFLFSRQEDAKPKLEE